VSIIIFCYFWPRTTVTVFLDDEIPPCLLSPMGNFVSKTRN
jgi:hypothetical protein